MRRLIVLVALCALALSACSIDDWTAFGFNNRNTFNNIGGVSQDAINTSNASQLQRAWTSNVVQGGYGSSGVVTWTDTNQYKNQHAYFDNSGILWSVNTVTHKVDCAANDGSETSGSSANDPVVSDGGLGWYNSQAGNEFELYDLQTCAERGGTDVAQSDSVHPTLTMNNDGYIYVGTGYDEVDGTGTRQLFGSVTKQPTTAAAPGWQTWMATPVWSPPAIMNGVVYATTYDTLYAIRNSDGTVLWQTTLAPGHTSPLRAPIAVPTVNGAANTPTIFVTSESTVWSVNASTGAVRWAHSNNVLRNAGATIANNQLLVAATGGTGAPVLVSLDATTGAAGYSKTLATPSGASLDTLYEPATTNGVLVMADGTAAWALRITDGAVLKSMVVAGNTSAHPTISEGDVFFPVANGIDVWGLPS
ncbi:MAG TPA: PQQ-binding-like beta-propeller repeat protein [Acidimicrobiia bacterium]|nr:PQQ-binding-like beta-propeller repeat protein [Acidimicrobiia bacterium]